MREIRFRAWWKPENKMVSLSSIDFKNQQADLYVIENGREVYASADFPDLELLEFTGLRDKNGLSIYEGDILDTHLQQFKRFRTVIFSQGVFTLEPRLSGFELVLSEPEGYEVIGNVYEHPDLLTEKV